MKGRTLLRNIGKMVKEKGIEDEVMIFVAHKDGSITTKRILPPDAEKNECLTKIWNGLWDL